MRYFQITEVRYGTCPDWNNDWNRAEIVFKGDKVNVNPKLLAEIARHQMICFPEDEVRRFSGTRSFSQQPLTTKDRSIILSFGIYGGRDISLKDLRTFADEQVLPKLEAAYARVDEARKILAVLKAAGEPA